MRDGPHHPGHARIAIAATSFSSFSVAPLAAWTALAFGVAYKVPAVVAEQMKGRLDLGKYNSNSSHELPLGATYVIYKAGIIRYAFVDSDYRKRAAPPAVVAALKGQKKAH